MVRILSLILMLILLSSFGCQTRSLGRKPQGTSVKETIGISNNFVFPQLSNLLAAQSCLA